MSKIGKVPIHIPDGITVERNDPKIVVKGQKGQLSVNIPKGVKVEIAEGEVNVTILENLENGKAYWGLIRSLINNAIDGLTGGYTKELELVGVGYRVEKVGNKLKFAIGYSHPVDFEAPEGITFNVPSNTEIKVEGIDKQLVGQVAANIRDIRRPEPYKGKGIRYKGEQVKRKQGKTAKAAA